MFASVEEAISSEIKRLMLKIKYLTLYLCLFFCLKGYFSQRNNTFFCDGKIKRVSPHNFKLTFRYVAILQSGSFGLYRVTRCYYLTESNFIVSFEFTQSNPVEHFLYLLFKIHFPLTKNDLQLQLNAISKCASVLRFRRKEKT